MNSELLSPLVGMVARRGKAYGKDHAAVRSRKREINSFVNAISGVQQERRKREEALLAGRRPTKSRLGRERVKRGEGEGK